MGSKLGKRPLLRDMLVNLVGTFVGALLALFTAFYLYGFESRNRCEDQLKMMIDECKENREVCKLITDKLKFINKQGSKIIVQPISLRLFSKVVNAAAESEYVLRYTPPDLRKDIYNHSEILVLVNRKLESFDDYLYSTLGNPQASFSFIKQWVTLLQNDINNISVGSEDLIKRTSLFLAN